MSTTTLSDAKSTHYDGAVHYTPRITSLTDYYPFGAGMPGRGFSEGNYRYGFNGMEGDDEIQGDGNSYTTLFRQYDPRLGRWLSNDPVTHFWQSPYISMGNNPIVFTDPLGDKIIAENRKQKREFRREMKRRGTWNDIRKKYRGKEFDLKITDRVWSDQNIATAEITATARPEGNDWFKKQDWFVFHSEVTTQSANLAGRSDDTPLTRMNPINANVIPSNINIPQIIQPIPIPISPAYPAPVNFNMNTPFIGGAVAFANPVQANNQLQNAANAFLNNPNATQIVIVVGTSTLNLNQPSATPGMNMRQLLTARGRLVMNQLRIMGVPDSAFQNNWLQFAPGTAISTTVRVR